MIAPTPKQFQQASGALTGKLQDASAGLEKRLDSAGNVWAWNTAGTFSEWMLVYELQPGDTIWGKLPGWYGAQTLDLVHLVRDVPQNTPILGGDAAQAYPGDVILIPNLQDPYGGAPPIVVGPTTPEITPPPPNGGPAPIPTGNEEQPAPNGNGTPNGNGEIVVPNGNGNGAGAGTWWTPGKKVAVGVAGGVAVLGIGWLIYRSQR